MSCIPIIVSYIVGAGLAPALGPCSYMVCSIALPGPYIVGAGLAPALGVGWGGLLLVRLHKVNSNIRDRIPRITDTCEQEQNRNATNAIQSRYRIAQEQNC